MVSRLDTALQLWIHFIFSAITHMCSYFGIIIIIAWSSIAIMPSNNYNLTMRLISDLLFLYYKI